MKRNSKGQFRQSYLKKFTPAILLVSSILFCYFIQEYYKETELLSPYVSTFTVRAMETEPTPTPNPWKTATITAYSCNGITDNYHLMMNCPSLKHYPTPRTANGTEPIIDKTMACDPANMGRVFEIRGLGRRTCTDTGGDIKGAGRFDLYVESINVAYQWGTKTVEYKLIN